MYVKGKLFVDGQSYIIKNCHIHVPGPKLNPMGIPISLGGAPEIKIKIDRTEHSYFLGWHYNIIKKDHVELVFNDARMEQKSRRLDLYDVQCVSVQEFFSNDNSGPDYLEFKLVPAIFVANGLLVREMNWKTQSWESIKNAKNIMPTELPKEGQILDHYLENEEGKRVTNCKKDQTVFLIVESKDMVGKTICVDLSDDTIDYEYNGKYLENDLLEDIKITADRIKIKLKTLKQRK